uniref:Uncharacterized protein n=1 Tax=Anguilla anguilla TaxID=7936 RepID=A0A0E9S052_ANGAN
MYKRSFKKGTKPRCAHSN